MTHNGKRIRIFYRPFPEELHKKAFGLTAREGMCYTVIIDSTIDDYIQDYVLGHELAHIFLNHLEQEESGTREQEQVAHDEAWVYYWKYVNGEL